MTEIFKLELIESGMIDDQLSGKKVNYEISFGLSSTYAANADVDWLTFNFMIVSKLKEVCKTNEELLEHLARYQFEDSHWNWVNKSVVLSTDEYEWFYFIAENQVQGICNIYHPKPSKIDNRNIFYVEFVAVAPWNRINPISPRKFKGIGSSLLKIALNYSINTLNYRPGFSLHSLPQSAEYYEKIGMKNFGPDNSKQNLFYFEMEQGSSEAFIHA